MLGAASGAVAGLVAITPACGTVGPMGGIVIGLAAGFVCLWGVNGLKRILGADDSLDVFGVHGVGGILGALLTGVFSAGSLGGVKGGEVIGSPELSWPEARAAVLLPEQEANRKQLEAAGWTCFSTTDGDLSADDFHALCELVEPSQ